MDITKYYSECKGSDAAILLLLGSGGSNALTKGVAKWLVRRGVSVLSLGPEEGVVGYHSFPLERAEEAIAQLRARGVRKFGVLGASVTSIPALSAAARIPDITLTMVVAPCDFVLQGFTQGRRDGCREWPLEGESMMTWRGEPLPYVPYAYQHPDYWRIVQAETKGSGNIMTCHKIFRDTEERRPLTEEVMIPVEDIRGRLLLIGCEDDSTWFPARYIRRMEKRLKERAAKSEYDAVVYEHGTHFAFPESMLRQLLPLFPDFLVGRAFRAAREFPKECRATREDVDRRMSAAIAGWLKEE